MRELHLHSEVFRGVLTATALLYALIIWCRQRDLSPKVSFRLAAIFALFCLVWLATCPVIWDSPSDRNSWATTFEWAREYAESIRPYLSMRDPVWQAFKYLCTRIMDYRGWFLITALLYVGSYFLASCRLCRRNVAAMFIAVTGGFAFYSYGVNAVRAGVSLALIFLSYTYTEEKWKMFACMAAALCAHFSSGIPACAMLLSLPIITRKCDRQQTIKRLGLLFILWIAIMTVSGLFGREVTDCFNRIASGTDRLSYLANRPDCGYRTGFRVDFILFSLFPIVVSAFYLLICKYRSFVYCRILSAYLLANTFWLPVIRVPFTDRFAYLSWFLMPFLLISPLTDKNLNLKHRTLILPAAILGEIVLFNYIL